MHPIHGFICSSARYFEGAGNAALLPNVAVVSDFSSKFEIPRVEEMA
jgi:hypothetical protein